MVSANFQDLDAEIVCEYPYAAYLAAPPAFKTNLEPVVLSEVVARSHGCLDQEYLSRDSCAKLLESDNCLKDLLLSCWEQGSFRALRESAKLDTKPRPSLPMGLQIKKEVDASGFSTPTPSMSSPQIRGGQTVEIYGGNFTEVASGGKQINYYGQQCHGLSEEQLNWIPSIDYHKRHLQIFASRKGRTGEWILGTQSFQRWVSDSEKRLLWCHGNPGSGKTVISSIIVEHLKSRLGQNTASVGFIYLDYAKHLEQSLEITLASLLRRVVQVSRDESLIGILIPFYDRHYKERTHPTIDELSELLNTIYRTFSCVYLIVDAVDEYCETLSLSRIRELLSTLLSLGTHVKLMVTSRVLGCIGNVLSSYNAIRQEIAPNSTDLEYYIKARVATDISFAIPCAGIIAQKVSETSRFSFLLARLHMDSISQHLTVGHVLDSLTDISANIDSAYDSVVDRIRQQPALRRELASRIICWIAYGGKLSLEELRHALAVAHGRYALENYLHSKETISEVCAGLLDVEKTEEISGCGGVIIRQIPSFIHFTTYDYFHRMRGPNAYQFLAETCVAYLSNPAFSFCSQDISMTDPTSTMELYWELAQMAPDSSEGRVDHHMANLSSTDTYPKGNIDRHDKSLKHEFVKLFRTYPFLLPAARFWGALCLKAQPEPVIGLVELLEDPKKAFFLSLFNRETAGGKGVYLAVFYRLESTFRVLLGSISEGEELLVEGERSPYRSLLSLAAVTGQVNVVRALINRYLATSNTNPPCVTEIVAEALIIACNFEHVEIAHTLLRFPRINLAYINKSGSGLLMAATAIPSILRILLLETDLDLNHSNALGTTALITCVTRGRQEAFKMLLQDSRIDPNVSNRVGMTALAYALEMKEYQMVELLLDHPQIEPLSAEGTRLSSLV